MKYAPAARTTAPASIRSPAAVTTPSARVPSSTSRSTGASASTLRFGLERAASRYAKAAFQRVPSTTFAGSVARPTGCAESSGSSSR